MDKSKGKGVGNDTGVGKDKGKGKGKGFRIRDVIDRAEQAQSIGRGKGKSFRDQGGAAASSGWSGNQRGAAASIGRGKGREGGVEAEMRMRLQYLEYELQALNARVTEVNVEMRELRRDIQTVFDL